MGNYVSQNKILSIIFIIIIFGSIVFSCLGFPDFIDKIRLGRGEDLIIKNKFSQGIAELEISASNPYNKSDAYYYEALGYFYLKDYEKALLYCDKVLHIMSTDYEAQILKARIFYIQGNVEESLKIVDVAISLSPGFSMGYAYRALFNYQINHYYDALNDADRSILLDPRQALPYVVRGLIHLQAGQIKIEELDKAISDFSQALDINDQDPQALLNRGIAYTKKGDNVAAITDLNTLLRLSTEEEILTSARSWLTQISKK
jgi:tetratricopeptide (TPR) repeat protein